MVDLDSEETRLDPYPAYEAVRRAGSAVRDPERNVWYVGRYHDAAAILRNPDRFSNHGTGVEPTLTGADGAPHARSRSLLAPAFSSSQLAKLDGTIRLLANELSARNMSRGGCELMEAVASAVPAAVIAWLLRIDEARLPDIRRWSAAIVLGGARNVAAIREQRGWLRKLLPRPANETAPVADALSECKSFLLDHFERADARAGEGRLVDVLAGHRDNGRLTKEEMLNLGFLMIVAGTETTTNLIGNAVLLLAREPWIQSHIRDNPGVMGAFIEEVLRYEAPVQRRIRYTDRPSRIGDTTVPSGARIEILIGSANRDPGKFPDAARFRFDRGPNRHLSFGLGPHFCLGSQLARREAHWTLTALIRHSSTITLADPGSRIAYPRTLVVRGPQELHLVFH